MDYVELNHRRRFPGTWCVVPAFMTSPLVLEWAFLDRRMIVVRIMPILIPVMAISSLPDVRTASMNVRNVFHGYGLILRTHGEDDAMDSHGKMHHVRMVIDHHHHRIMISEPSGNGTWSMMGRVNS